MLCRLGKKEVQFKLLPFKLKKRKLDIELIQ